MNQSPVRSGPFRPTRFPMRLHSTRVRCWLMSVALFGLWLPAQVEGAKTTDRILAIVNDDVITLSEVRANIRGEETQLRAQYNGTDLDRQLQQLQHKALSRLIERKLQLQLANKRGHRVTDDEVTHAIEAIRQQGNQVDLTDPQVFQSIKEQLLVLKVLEREVRSGVMVSEEELERYYEDHLSEFSLPEEYRLSQILIRSRMAEAPEEVRARAEEVRRAIQDGADFAEIARSRSDGDEGAQGGILGFVSQGELEPALEDAIARLQPGDISPPTLTDNGLHIIRLDERKPLRFRPYPEVTREIQALLYKQKSEERYHTWIEELKDQSYIEIKF